tara:strand:+ start:177 stop:638 length:462 start_codon:yes stop_codon:yes gene_type:complete
VRFLQLHRSRLGAWMRADRAAGDDVARDGGCWGGPHRAPGVTFDNGRRLVVLPTLLQSEVGGSTDAPYAPSAALKTFLHHLTPLTHTPSPLAPYTTPLQVAGQGVCYRLQLPLKPAWAVTIHKSQGMSLDAAAVQVRQSFSTNTIPAPLIYHP